jgi:hypothetical protein
MRLFGIIALSATLGAISMLAFLSWQQRPSSTAVGAYPIAQSESARQKLRVLQTEMGNVLRMAEKESPERRQEIRLAWQEAHREEMEALRREIAAGQPRRSSPSSTKPSNLSGEQPRNWPQRQSRIQKHQHLTALMSQAPSAERDKQIAQLRQEIHAEQTKEIQEWTRAEKAGLSLEERARRQELEALQRRRVELLISLRSAKPAARRQAMEQWEKENGSKLRALQSQRSTNVETRVKVSIPKQSGLTNRPRTGS